VYGNKSVDARQVGRELAVGYVVEGSVQRTGERIEVNVRLVDTKTGLQRWADRFDIDRRDLAQAQADITSRLARTLNLGLVEVETRRIEQQRQTNPDARELAMRGWALWYRPFTPANRMQALDSFERALSIDPHSVDALVGAALILAANVSTGISHDRDHDIARAEHLIESALTLDPNSSDAYQTLGFIRRLQGRVDESATQLEKSIALNHNNMHAIFLLGQVRLSQGRPEAALALVDQAYRLNPRDPNLAFDQWARGACALLSGRVDDAVGHLRNATVENPRIYFFQLYFAAALGLKGDIDAAKGALATALKLAPEVNSLAKWRAAQPWIADPRYWALFEKTGLIGLRRAGMPEGPIAEARSNQ
jgi:tetratricopeptide (TPR) repeat protein